MGKWLVAHTFIRGGHTAGLGKSSGPTSAISCLCGQEEVIWPTSVWAFVKQNHWTRLISNFFPAPKTVERMICIFALTQWSRFGLFIHAGNIEVPLLCQIGSRPGLGAIYNGKYTTGPSEFTVSWKRDNKQEKNIYKYELKWPHPIHGRRLMKIRECSSDRFHFSREVKPPAKRALRRWGRGEDLRREKKYKTVISEGDKELTEKCSQMTRQDWEPSWGLRSRI